MFTPGDFTVNSGLQSQSESLIERNSQQLVSVELSVLVRPLMRCRIQSPDQQLLRESATPARHHQSDHPFGGNQFHATLFEFFRNNNLDATHFQQPTVSLSAVYVYQFGGSVEGPAVAALHGRTKLFLFNYDGLRRTPDSQFWPRCQHPCKGAAIFPKRLPRAAQ